MPARPTLRRAYEAFCRSALRLSISSCPRWMEHQSLCCWATGMPHSTQIRTRSLGAGAFDEKSRFSNDIPGLQGRVTRRCAYAWSRGRVTTAQSDRSRQSHLLDQRILQRVGTARMARQVYRSLPFDAHSRTRARTPSWQGPQRHALSRLSTRLRRLPRNRASCSAWRLTREMLPAPLIP